MAGVVTGEAVRLDLREAQLPVRMLSALVDGALQLTLLLALLFGLGYALSGGLDSAAGAALSVVVLVTVWVGYPVFFESVLRGRTPGLAALGLRVVRDDGGRVGFRHALVRGLLAGLVEKPGITFYSAGMLCILFHPRAKRLGDVLAGTVVVAEARRSVGRAAPPDMPPRLAGWAAVAELGRLDPPLLDSARDVLLRSARLAPPARDRLQRDVAGRVRALVTPPPPPDAPDWAVLAAVLAERRRRSTAAVPVAPGQGPAAAGGPAATWGPAQPPPQGPPTGHAPVPPRSRDGADGGHGAPRSDPSPPDDGHRDRRREPHGDGSASGFTLPG